MVSETSDDEDEAAAAAIYWFAAGRKFGGEGQYNSCRWSHAYPTESPLPLKSLGVGGMISESHIL